MTTSWEAERRWEVVRYLVYYLQENFVLSPWVQGKDVVDFSCGLGDLSIYLQSLKPKSLCATVPEKDHVPLLLKDRNDIQQISGVEASQIKKAFSPESKDLFVARMVFQFPTMEDHFIDVDGMLEQIFTILRPGGRVVICSHEYKELYDHPSLWNLDIKNYKEKLLDLVEGEYKQRVMDYFELIETIGLPPREGVHGQTGFGLKSLMCVDSFVQAGFHLEICDHLEDFTFPRGLYKALHGEGDWPFFDQLAKKVFAIKQKYILSKEFQDKYQRPGLLQKVYGELLDLHPFITIPIFRIVAQKPFS
ncbi:MAG: class I SAM-dependent methyltransferase [Bdellovibrio sp.]|nr:MAG: class I SAM-dependent methyltransferase [Bdellovibrio sp.]